MEIAKICFWLSVVVVWYTYIGYGLVVWIWASGIRFFKGGAPRISGDYEPMVTLVVPAYNEAAILRSKIADCLALDYPKEKLQLIIITDGSTDNSSSILSDYPNILHLHLPARGGKSLAENRAMEYVKNPYVIFTDCNTYLNTRAIREMVKHYEDPSVGAVSGEKRIFQENTNAGSGEGLYWKYESFLKRCDASIYSLMGAAGELVSFKTELFRPLEKDTILDDFVQSLRIVKQGYRVVYEPLAYASEPPSHNLNDEMKRKIRICAGGWQAMTRLGALLNPFTHPVVFFLYFSHRVLRWSLTPALLAVLLALSGFLALKVGGFYTLAFVAQILFYLSASIGWMGEQRGHTFKVLLVPLYFTMMNVAVIAGFIRFLKGTQSAAWEKAERYPTSSPPSLSPANS